MKTGRGKVLVSRHQVFREVVHQFWNSKKNTNNSHGFWLHVGNPLGNHTRWPRKHVLCVLKYMIQTKSDKCAALLFYLCRKELTGLVSIFWQLCSYLETVCPTRTIKCRCWLTDIGFGMLQGWHLAPVLFPMTCISALWCS